MKEDSESGNVFPKASLYLGDSVKQGFLPGSV